MTGPLVIVNLILAALVVTVGLERGSADGMMFYLLAALTLYAAVEIYTDRSRLAISTKLLLWTLNLFCSVVTMMIFYFVQAGWTAWMLLVAMAVTASATLLTLLMVASSSDEDEDDEDEDEPWMRERG